MIWVQRGESDDAVEWGRNDAYKSAAVAENGNVVNSAWYRSFHPIGATGLHLDMCSKGEAGLPCSQRSFNLIMMKKNKLGESRS